MRVGILSNIAFLALLCGNPTGHAGPLSESIGSSRSPSTPSSHDEGGILIDKKTESDPYYVMGLRAGKNAAKAELQAMDCDSFDSMESFDFDGATQQPYRLGYLKGYYGTIEEARLSTLKQCIQKPVESENSQHLESMARRVKAIREAYADALKKMVEAGCTSSSEKRFCPTSSLNSILKSNYTACTVFFLGPIQLSSINDAIESLNNRQVKLIQQQNSALLSELASLSRDHEITDSEISRIQQIAQSLRKSNEIEQVEELNTSF